MHLNLPSVFKNIGKVALLFFWCFFSCSKYSEPVPESKLVEIQKDEIKALINIALINIKIEDPSTFQSLKGRWITMKGLSEEYYRACGVGIPGMEVDKELWGFEIMLINGEVLVKESSENSGNQSQ